MTSTITTNIPNNILSLNSSEEKDLVTKVDSCSWFLELLKANCPFEDEQQKQFYFSYAIRLFNSSRDKKFFSQKQIFLLFQVLITSIKQQIRIVGLRPLGKRQLLFLLQLDECLDFVISVKNNRYNLELVDSFHTQLDDARYNITFDELNQYFLEMKQEHIQRRIARGERSVHIPLLSSLILSLKEFQEKRKENPQRSPQMVELEQEFVSLVLQLNRQTTHSIEFEVCDSLFSYHQLKILIPLIKSAITYNMRIWNIVAVQDLKVELNTYCQILKVIYNPESSLCEIQLTDWIEGTTCLNVSTNDLAQVMDLRNSLQLKPF